MAKNPGGRPKVNVDMRMLETLASCHLTHEQIADVLGISLRTVIRSFGTKIKEYRSKGKAKLAIKAHQLAEKGNPQMLKFLLGNHLQWSERMTIEQNTDLTGQVVVYRAYNPADLKEK